MSFSYGSGVGTSEFDFAGIVKIDSPLAFAGVGCMVVTQIVSPHFWSRKKPFAAFFKYNNPVQDHLFNNFLFGNAKKIRYAKGLSCCLHLRRINQINISRGALQELNCLMTIELL